jgi:hypothetical protein
VPSSFGGWGKHRERLNLDSPPRSNFTRTDNLNLIGATTPPTIRTVEATAQQLNLADFMDVENASSEELAKIRAYQKDSEEQGGLITQAQANAVLGVSSGRTYQLVKAGTLESYEHFGVKLISCDQLIAYAKLEKKAGSVGSTLVQALKNSLQKEG